MGHGAWGKRGVWEVWEVWEDVEEIFPPTLPTLPHLSISPFPFTLSPFPLTFSPSPHLTTPYFFAILQYSWMTFTSKVVFCKERMAATVAFAPAMVVMIGIL